MAFGAAPSDQVVLGVIGAGGRGTLVMTIFQKDPSVRVGAICDVYEPNLERGLSTASKAPGNQPKAYRNYKQLLADKDIDAVLIATPEHWHHRMVLDALAAGKDVYVEKPLCQTPEQGVELVEAEKKSKNIVQVGMQRRSYDLYLEGRDIVAAGTLGKVRMVRSWWLNNYLGGGQRREARRPARLGAVAGAGEEARSAGPVPLPQLAPLLRLRGRHRGRPGRARLRRHPPADERELSAGRHRRRRQAAQGRLRHARVGGGDRRVSRGLHRRLHHQLRGHALQDAQRPDEPAGRRQGAHGHRARRTTRSTCRAPRRSRPSSKTSAKGFGYATDLHVANFLECVRTRKTPTASMALGFQAALVVQLANLSLKTGRRMKWNYAAGKVEV